MSTGTIVIVEKGHTMPAAFRQLLLSNNTASFAVMLADKNFIEKMEVFKEKHSLDKALFEFENSTKDRLLIVQARHSTQEKEEQQPFELLWDEAGKPILTAFIDGDFTVYMDDKAEFCPEAEFVREFLGQRVDDMYEESGRDIKKLMQMLDTDEFRVELAEHMEPAGSMVMLGTPGYAIYFARANTTFEKFDWGSTTNTHGYAEKKPAETMEKHVTAEPELKKLTFKEKQALKAAGSAPTATSVPATPTKAQGDSNATGKEQEYPTVDRPTPPVPQYNPKLGQVLQGRLFPPEGLNMKDRKKWYQRHRNVGLSGIIVENNPGIPASEVAKHSHFFPLMVTGNVQEAPPLSQGAIDNNGSSGLLAPVTPLAPRHQVEKAIAIIKKDPAIPLTEEQLKAVDAKYAPFSETHGITLEHLCCLSFKTFCEIGIDAGSRDLACLAHELRCQVLKLDPGLKKRVLAEAEKKETAPVKDEGRKLTFKEKQLLAKSA